MVTAIKYYLVDSENVNDNWLMLFDMIDETDNIIVFYTKNSPHMSYPSVIRLLKINRTIKFEECFEGNNALDFQLISYMGYLMKNSDIENSEFIVMSNDTGFDSAINFWKSKGFHVNRINVNYCKQTLQKQNNTVEEATPAPVINKQYNFNKDEVDMFINCLGRDNLVSIHETLVHVYGQQKGQIIYKEVKDKTYPLAEQNLTRNEKVKKFTDIIFSHSDYKDPGNFVDFLNQNKTKAKNLNGVRAAITKAYGENDGKNYYSLFKPYFKIISALK